MFVAIPYILQSGADYAGLSQSIQRYGTNPGHTLAVVSLRSEDEGAYLFGSALSDYFGRHAKVSVEDAPRTMTELSNSFFVRTLDAFSKYKPGPKEAANAPLLYFDPSYRPSNPRWLDDLQSEYFQRGAPPVMGQFTPEGRTDGPIIIGRGVPATWPLLPFLPADQHWRNFLTWDLARGSVKANGIGPHPSAVLSPYFEI